MPEGKSAWYNSLGNEGVCLNVFIDSSLGELLPLHDIMEELTGFLPGKKEIPIVTRK